MTKSFIQLRAFVSICFLLASISCGDKSANSNAERRAASNTSNTGTAAAPATTASPDKKAADIDPCSLITKAEVAEILGEIKEGPTPDTGLQNDKLCRYSNMNGSHLTIGVGGADRWELEKNLTNANDQKDIAGLGDEAFSIRRGTESEVYVKKGGALLQVRTTSGLDVARRVAEKALTRL